MYELIQLLRVNNVKELCKLGKYIMFKVVHSELTPIYVKHLNNPCLHFILHIYV